MQESFALGFICTSKQFYLRNKNLGGNKAVSRCNDLAKDLGFPEVCAFVRSIAVTFAAKSYSQ